MPLRRKLILTPLIHSLSVRELQVIPRAAVVVSPEGIIEDVRTVADNQEEAYIVSEWEGNAELEVVRAGEGQFLVPGLVDTHTHAPQYPNLGYGHDLQLLDWLSQVTFPTEARFSDAAYARRVYERVVDRVLSSGTTTCSYYGTLHLEATKALADICHKRGQRALIGKCNMDSRCPESYTEASCESSLSDTKSLITYIRSLPSNAASPTPPPTPPSSTATLIPAPSSSSSSAPIPSLPSCSSSSSSSLVHPILTPRFAISCSSELLSSLGELARADETLRVQTHLSENEGEIAFTRELFPDATSYTDVYDRFGLLGQRTILAHCVHLSGEEMDVIKARGAGVSHCANSNFNLRSGIAQIDEMLDRGLKVGLGTDCSGGYALGILSAIRAASTASKVNTFIRPSTTPSSSSAPSAFASTHLPLPALFYLATLGGAEVCAFSDQIGNFVIGKEFDALLVDTKGGGNPALFWTEDDTLERLFEKWLFTGDERNLRDVWVRGRRVAGRGEKLVE